MNQNELQHKDFK